MSVSDGVLFAIPNSATSTPSTAIPADQGRRPEVLPVSLGGGGQIGTGVEHGLHFLTRFFALVREEEIRSEVAFVRAVVPSAHGVRRVALCTSSTPSAIPIVGAAEYIAWMGVRSVGSQRARECAGRFGTTPRASTRALVLFDGGDLGPGLLGSEVVSIFHARLEDEIGAAS